MKKFLFVLFAAALALPMMAQKTAATKAECMRSQDRDKMEFFAPVKAFDASAITVAEKTRGGYLWDFETDESFDGWMTYDADGDGYAWEVDDYYSYNGGTYSLTSRSYYGGTVLYPDNWLISPTVSLDGILSIFTENYGSYYRDKIMVYVYVGEFDDVDDLDDFVPISDFIDPGTSWEEHTFDLSEYAGATGCFAIRHYDCVDQIRILVDYISLGFREPDPTTPEEVTVVPGNTTANVTWTDEDDTMWNLRYRVYTEPTGYFWDFEEPAADDYSLPGGWTCIDADGDGYEWYHLNQSGGYQTHSGYGHLTSASYANYTGLNPDNWLVSPKVKLVGNLSFWACGQDPSYPEEVFCVYASTDMVNWVPLTDDITATGEMTEYTFDLSAFDGAEGYVAIRHYNCYDQFRLNVDDIMIGTPSEEAEWIYVYGLTDTNYFIEGLTPETTYEVQVQAVNANEKESAWTESTLFTTLAASAERTGSPVFNGYTTDGIHAYFVEINETEPSTIYYKVYKWDDAIGDWVIVGDDEWIEYVDILSFTEDGKYRVVAYALADGKAPSYDIAYEFVVSPKTGISEMTEGKTVASTRYFNMAGQEMSKAEGMTIVVTTYTDGTTSAMKVVK